MSELIINPQEELRKRNQKMKKWAIIWAVGTFGALVAILIFMTATKSEIPPPNLPLWMLAPAITGIILAIPLSIKAWQADKLKAQLHQNQKGGK